MGRKATDITHIRFGNLVAMRPVGATAHGAVQWECACDCGRVHRTTYRTLAAGQCTRCAHCRARGKRIITEPKLQVRAYLQGAGTLGGICVAEDAQGGILAATGWLTRAAVPGGSIWQYPPMRGLFATLTRLGHGDERRPSETWDRWAARNAVAVHPPDYTAATAVLWGVWQRIKASGVLAHASDTEWASWERNARAAIDRASRPTAPAIHADLPSPLPSGALAQLLAQWNQEDTPIDTPLDR